MQRVLGADASCVLVCSERGTLEMCAPGSQNRDRSYLMTLEDFAQVHAEYLLYRGISSQGTQ
jgi:hypothetical protein